jgi:hypothetical protein
LFYGFVLVLIALGVLIFIGRRRQKAAQAKAAEGAGGATPGARSPRSR